MKTILSKTKINIVCLILFVVSCRDLPPERTNSLDRLADNYAPAAPVLYGYQFDLNVVHLLWVNKSIHAEGFRLERRLQSQLEFQVVAQYEKNAFPMINTLYYFNDTSSSLTSGKWVEYRVYAFVDSRISSPSNGYSLVLY